MICRKMLQLSLSSFGIIHFFFFLVTIFLVFRDYRDWVSKNLNSNNIFVSCNYKYWRVAVKMCCHFSRIGNSISIDSDIPSDSGLTVINFHVIEINLRRMCSTRTYLVFLSKNKCALPSIITIKAPTPFV